MGLAGGLVKSVFSRSRSATIHDSHGRHSAGGGMERRRWSSVRSYLCGDEFNSVVAEEDSASIKSSEATVQQQPPLSGLAGEDEVINENNSNSNSNCMFDEEDAAIVIQSAFRRFQVRRGVERRSGEEKDEVVGLGGGISPSRESIGTSIEVQTANSVKAFSVVDETAVGNHRAQLRSRAQQLFKTKNDWDDSTVSSNISKMRVQHRLEAMTRRERALAYAFSQQLRICSKKRTAQSDETGPDMGWTWLERWMATRVPDKYKDTEQVEPCGTLVLGKRLADLGVEKESCGSNSVSIHLDSVSVAENTENNNTNKIAIPRNPLRRKSVTKRQCQRVHAQISKKDSTKEGATSVDKRNKQESKEQDQCPDTESENSITAASRLLDQ